MAQLIKTVGGLAIANVKTINGLAIASVKEIGGVDNTPSASASVAFEGYETAAANGTSVVCNVPAAATDGRMMLAFFACTDMVGYDFDVQVTPPSGWTRVPFENTVDTGGGTQITLYYKLASSEPASYTWTHSGTRRMRVIISAWSSMGSDPIESYSATSYTTNDATVRSGSVTTSEANQTVINFAASYGSTALTFTPPTDYTEHVDVGDTGTGRHWIEISSREIASAGATGNIDATLSLSTTLKAGIALVIAGA